MIGTDPKTEKESANREELTPARIHRYLAELDEAIPEKATIRGLSFGGETPAVIAGKEGKNGFSTRANDIDLYADVISSGEKDPDWEQNGFQVPEESGPEEMLQFKSDGGDSDEGIIVDIQRDASIPTNTSIDWINDIASSEMQESEIFYKGQGLEVSSPSPEFFYMLKTRTGPIHREERQKYKREIEKLNEAADTEFNPWAVYPSVDQNVGWRAEVSLEDGSNVESVIEDIGDKLEDYTDSLYKLEKDGDRHRLTSPDLVTSAYISAENDGDFVSASTGFSSGSTFYEVGLIERALIEVLEDRGLDYNSNQWKYETESVGVSQNLDILESNELEQFI